MLDQVALESASSQIYQLFSSYGWFPFHFLNIKSLKQSIAGVWKVVFRRLAARQPFYNWELRFSVEEEHTGGETLEQADGGGEIAEQHDGGETVEQAEAGGDAAEQHAAGEIVEQVEGGEIGGEPDGEPGGDEDEGDSQGEKSFKRWVVRLLRVEERWRMKGFQPFI